MIEHKFYCKHCNLSIAPADPGRITLGTTGAHKTCLMSAIGVSLNDDVMSFLTTHAGPETAWEFADRIRSPRSYETFKRQVETFLRRAYLNGRGTDSIRQRAIKVFAKDLGERMLCEIDCMPYMGNLARAATDDKAAATDGRIVD